MNKHMIAAGLLAAGFLAAAPAQAQLKGFSFGPYVEAGWPTGRLDASHNTGFGGGLSADVKLPLSLGVTGSVGFMSFAGERVGNMRNLAVTAIPVRVGLKYRVSAAYFVLETGSATLVRRLGAYEGTSGLLSPGIGVRFLNFDVRAKYETWFRDGNFQFWGLQAGLRF